jgi:hypothetical protein
VDRHLDEAANEDHGTTVNIQSRVLIAAPLMPSVCDDAFMTGVRTNAAVPPPPSAPTL